MLLSYSFLFIAQRLYWFPVATVMSSHTLGGCHNRKACSHGSGGQQSEVRVSPRLVPSEALRFDPFHAFPLASGGCWQPWAFLGLWKRHCKSVPQKRTVEKRLE